MSNLPDERHIPALTVDGRVYLDQMTLEVTLDDLADLLQQRGSIKMQISASTVRELARWIGEMGLDG